MEKKYNNLSLDKSQYSEWDEGIFFLLVTIIVLLPIVFFPKSIPAFAPIKELIFQIVTLLSLSMWVLKIINQNSIKWPKSALDIPVLMYFLVGCLSLTWSINIYHTVLAIPFFVSGPLLYYIISNSIRTQEIIDRLLLIIIIVGTIMGIYGILQYLGIDFKFWAGNVGRQKVMGLFGNVNYFAEYLILPIALAAGLIVSKKKVFNRLLLYFALVVMSTTLFLTFTRGSYLAIFITIPVILFFYYRNTKNSTDKQHYRKIIIYFIIIVIITAVIIYIPHPWNERNTILGKLRQRATIETLQTSNSSILRRIATWKFTWMMIEDYTLLGSGLGTYDYHTLQYQANFFAQDDNRDIYPHGYALQAHNEYLQIWSELGIVGLLIFLSVLFIYYKSILKSFQKMKENEKSIAISLMGGVTAVLTDAVFGFPLQLAASWSLFWVFIGLTNTQVLVASSDKNYGNQSDIIKKTGGKIKRFETKNNYYQLIKKAILSLSVIAIMIFISLLLIKPFLSRVYWYYGNEQITEGNYNEGIKYYEKGLKWNPWQGEMYYNIGNVLAGKNLNQLALEYFLKAEKYVDYPNLPESIGALYIKHGEASKAIPYIERAVKYQKNKKSMVPFQLQLGNIYVIASELAKAELLFMKVIENDPKNVEAYYGLAAVYSKQKERFRTIEALKKVIEIAPKSKEAENAKDMLKKLEIEE